MEKFPMERFTVSLPQDQYNKFEEFRNKLGISRSDAIRKSMHLFMIQDENISKVSENVVGCITLMMSHEHIEINDDHSHKHLTDSPHDHDYSSRPIYANVQQTDEILKNDIQHHFHDIIISTMHVHLEYEKCLEIIAVSGPYKEVKKLKDSLQRLKSVLSIGFFIIDKEIK